MTGCIKRDHGVWTVVCKCDSCRENARKIAKRARTGRYQRVPSETAWAKLDQWVSEGFEPMWIASGCGVPEQLISHALQDRRKKGYPQRFGPKRAAQIVAGNMERATTGRRDATGTRRRLQALAVIGWDGTSLYIESGVHFVTLAAIQRGATKKVSAPVWRAIRDTYGRLENLPGPSNLARIRANKNGWFPPAMWDNPDTDPEPETGVLPGRTGKGADLDEFEFLLSCGESPEQAAARFGVTLGAIETAQARQAKKGAA